MVLGETTANVKDMNLAESEAKGQETTQIKTKETETYDQVALQNEITEVILSDTETNMYSAESEAEWEDATQTNAEDSAPTEDKKIKSKAETETRYKDNNYGWKRESLVETLREYIVHVDWDGVYYLLSSYMDAITEEINSDGNTALHIAVGISRNDFIKRILSQIRDHDLTKIKNKDGSTILHIAAIVGNDNAAELLIKKDKELLHTPDHKGQTPLDKAFENMHLNTVAYLLEAIDVERTSKTKSSLLPPVERGVDFLVNAISAKQYDLASKLINRNPEYAIYNDSILMALARTFPSGLDYWETLIYPSQVDIHETIVKINKRLFTIWVCSPCIVDMIAFIIHFRFRRKLIDAVNLILLIGIVLILVLLTMAYYAFVLILLFLLMVYFAFYMLYFLLWKFAARVVPPINNIEQKKMAYEGAKMILNLVCRNIRRRHPNNSRELYTEPILEAARQDAYEVVDEILRRWPEAIRCEDKNGYDIIQLATMHRSEKIYNMIYIIGERKSVYGTIEDSSKNNMLHLAGRLAPSNKLKLKTGAALQLQRELQWFQEVQKLVFPTYVTKENIFMETPEMIFTREHENLVKEGEQWMKTVAESSSITAALITTIVFAAAITVPGGSNQETGVPIFLKESAFTIFAISDAISLFFSATALLVFLSILTARFAEQDFLVRLPRRLIIGLCTLLLSTTSMMVAFSATLFLVFSHRKLWVLAPICGLALVPIGFFFFLQFPLILDLFRSTYISKFGKSNRNKFNPTSVRFFFGK